MTHTLGVIGLGHMASVIVRRLVERGVVPAEQIIAADVRPIELHALAVHVAPDNASVARAARTLLIAVRPQQFSDVAASLRGVLRGDHLLLSIMAGMPTATIAAAFAPIVPSVVRAMPNLPFARGTGVTGLFAAPNVREADVLTARRLFDAGGATLRIVDESQMDIVTALAGSGPAYFYYFVEVMSKAGAGLGLSEAQAQLLAAHACLGAGTLMAQPGATPRALRDAVTSAGGTTEAALRELSAGPAADALTRAVEAAFRRGQELGRKFASA